MSPTFGETIDADQQTYLDFGPKASGGPGDTACGDWLESRLAALGFQTRRQTFETPWIDPAGARIEVGPDTIPLWPFPTPDDRAILAGPVAFLGDRDGVAGCIAVHALPFRRWSSAVVPVLRTVVASARAAGATALILITDGPSGETLALNQPAEGAEAFPVATVGPRLAGPLTTAAWARRPATLTLAGPAGRRPAFNLIGEIGSSGPRLVVSTPRSGWFACGGERAPGVACWLALAAEIAARGDIRATLVATSGHEYEGLGAERFLDVEAPRPDEPDLWVHLGANLATRDCHDLGADLAFLDTADPQRFLVAHDAILEQARAAFAGQPGLDSPITPADGLHGELKTLADHGYRRLLGVFGAHRLHHAETDDGRSLSADLTRTVGLALRNVITGALFDAKT